METFKAKAEEEVKAKVKVFFGNTFSLSLALPLLSLPHSSLFNFALSPPFPRLCQEPT